MNLSKSAITPADFEIIKVRPYWTAEEYGAVHSIAPLTARRLAYSGQVESIKIGRSLRFKNTLIA